MYKFFRDKSERKYYEGKKQKALTYINHTIDAWFDVTGSTEYDRISEDTRLLIAQKLLAIRKLVNDI